MPMTGNRFDVPSDIFIFGNHTQQIIRDAVNDAAPEFANDLPGRQPWRVAIGRPDKALVVSWEETGPGFMNVAGPMPDEQALALFDASAGRRNYCELAEVPTLAEHFGARKLLLVLDVNDAKIDGDQWAAQVIDWLNDLPARKAETDNKARVLAAIPQPPEWDITAIAEACWVVESEDGCSQGTAFALEGVGLVTCHHVLHGAGGKMHGDLEMFQIRTPAIRHPVALEATSQIVDLSILKPPPSVTVWLTRSAVVDVEAMDHVAVCGFPNFRPGSSCSVSPGTIVATRMSRGGVRRLLTNAGIVAGMSGGPAVGEGRTVIGICANGAPYLQDTRDTEDQAIIPIAALDLLHT